MRQRRRVPTDADAELRTIAGRDAAKAIERLHRASEAFARERYGDAKRMLSPLHKSHPQAGGVRELMGLILYRQGRYAEAIEELEVFVTLTGSTDQHPVLMDSCRALRRYGRLDEYWSDLRHVSPSPDLLAEGRIVAAGALADRGRIVDAIRLLSRVPLEPRKVSEFHLRQWYALADLTERSGDVPGARRLFVRIRSIDPAFFDVTERLSNLR